MLSAGLVIESSAASAAARSSSVTLPGHDCGGQRQHHRVDQANGHRVVVADRHRNALRHRCRQPGQGGGQYSDFPKNAPDHQARRRINPNVEAIVAYKPDLVIVAGDTTGPDGAAGQARHPGAVGSGGHQPRLRNTSSSTSSAWPRAIVAQAKAEVAKIKAQIAQIVARPAEARASRHVLLRAGADYYSVTSSTFIGQVLGSVATCTSIADAAKGAAASGGYPQLSAEYIIKANPNYIFLADTMCCGQNAKKVAKRPGWSTITAVKAGQVVP